MPCFFDLLLKAVKNEYFPFLGTIEGKMKHLEFIFHPSPFTLHLSSFILHSSSFIVHC